EVYRLFPGRETPLEGLTKISSRIPPSDPVFKIIGLDVAREPSYSKMVIVDDPEGENSNISKET
ncbi:hypothetical protein LCGC14_3051310, partial [marine sediment metagenome]